MIPVKDTPNKRSSSALSFHAFLKYLKSTRVDCKVPKMVAIRTFSFKDSSVSFSRTTHSDKLQKLYGRKIISLQGFVPHMCPVSRLPLRATCLSADSRLNMPRSPDLLSYRASHSRMNVPISGFDLYATELCANAR